MPLGGAVSFVLVEDSEQLDPRPTEPEVHRAVGLALTTSPSASTHGYLTQKY